MKNRTITNKNIFTTNWAGEDRRSVKATLAGNGDYRVGWWKINQRIHRLIRPSATLEEIMFSFHARHHAIALSFLQCQADVQEVSAVIQSQGLVAGIRSACSVTGENRAV
jgi:protein subunit release factor B